jgi:hypothetical protein
MYGLLPRRNYTSLWTFIAENRFASHLVKVTYAGFQQNKLSGIRGERKCLMKLGITVIRSDLTVALQD